MERARRRGRRHVPAFGEWNYSYTDDGWPWVRGGSVAGETEACSEAWFNNNPDPPHQGKPAPPRKARRDRPSDGGKGRLHEATSGRSSRASDAGVVAAAATPVKAERPTRRRVDADLYRVPPPELASQRPRKKVVASSRLWMGCLGLNCVA
ncbi:hypothetical protein GUJ93_ZPchr0012g20609 [Zizania palustris]|uniref:Uncharacterized protein n=1 Tax=Zizania palustris TaxID=103762 RepID=A0A8J6BQT8_ZIZPA|nr:hypothetical protein GUJ93_ZPchr0012g20609 [Zizania palustris]